MIIRAAVEGDAEIIAEIYNDAVLNTTAIWNENRIDVANRIAWINSRQQVDFPVIVATDNDDTVLDMPLMVTGVPGTDIVIRLSIRFTFIKMHVVKARVPP